MLREKEYFAVKFDSVKRSVLFFCQQNDRNTKQTTARGPFTSSQPAIYPSRAFIVNKNRECMGNFSSKRFLARSLIFPECSIIYWHFLKSTRNDEWFRNFIVSKLAQEASYLLVENKMWYIFWLYVFFKLRQSHLDSAGNVPYVQRIKWI